ncbi:hypothetical protein WD019_02250 [Fictibacillus sp. Mic-4]|uniref:hypothetical protein n=1 Tax=Fictibacillus sp. Mic-4 TaxID=3132826 RepID=UPI003CF49464
MTASKQPKYTIGQSVRIAGIPTIYRIDDYELINGSHVYHLEGTPTTSLYAEDTLEPVEEDHDIIAVELEPMFDVGESVTIDGVPSVYRVIDMYPEFVYELQDVETGEIIEMDETVLAPASATKSNGEAVKMAKENAREQSAKEAAERKAKRKQQREDIDNLLDIANWNRKKYEETGDEAFREKEREQYKKIAELTMDNA